MEQFEVRHERIGKVRMADGREVDGVHAYIYWKDRLVAGPCRLYCVTLCLRGEGAVRGDDATDEQIIRGVLGDEDIMTGAPTFPQFYDDVMREGED
jgi:hypothetical protein